MAEAGVLEKIKEADLLPVHHTAALVAGQRSGVEEHAGAAFLQPVEKRPGVIGGFVGFGLGCGDGSEAFKVAGGAGLTGHGPITATRGPENELFFVR